MADCHWGMALGLGWTGSLVVHSNDSKARMSKGSPTALGRQIDKWFKLLTFFHREAVPDRGTRKSALKTAGLWSGEQHSKADQFCRGRSLPYRPTARD